MEKTINKNYYILSDKFNLDTFMKINREHWNIECSLHWRLVVILDKDYSKNHIGDSINDLSLIRKILFN